MEAYLDNSATTKVTESVLNVMVKALEQDYGNPSSKHLKGVAAENYMKEARNVIASRLKVDGKEITFTSCGTEANNLAVIGSAMANKRSGNHIITTCIEHPSVYNAMIELEERGFHVTYLPVDKYGNLDPVQLEEAIREDTILVSVIYVNNEIGSVQDIKKISEVIKKKNSETLLHVDAIQAFGKYNIYPKRLGIDIMSLSGHKIHGPKGIGAVFVRNKVKIKPILFGGGQEKDLRSGTENVPGIAGFGQAAKEAYDGHEKKIEHLYKLKERLIAGITDIEEVKVNAQKENLLDTAPHILSVGFVGIRSEVLLHALEERGVYVSSGSACASNHPQLSGTLKAIGLSPELLESTLRFSFTYDTSEEEIDYTIKVLKELVPALRRFKRR